jgi:hypothetical protein
MATFAELLAQRPGTRDEFARMLMEAMNAGDMQVTPGAYADPAGENAGPIWQPGSAQSAALDAFFGTQRGDLFRRGANEYTLMANYATPDFNAVGQVDYGAPTGYTFTGPTMNDPYQSNNHVGRWTGTIGLDGKVGGLQWVNDSTNETFFDKIAPLLPIAFAAAMNPGLAAGMLGAEGGATGVGAGAIEGAVGIPELGLATQAGAGIGGAAAPISASAISSLGSGAGWGDIAAALSQGNVSAALQAGAGKLLTSPSTAGRLVSALTGGSGGGGGMNLSDLFSGNGIADIGRLAYLLNDFNRADDQADNAANDLRDAMGFQRDQIQRSVDTADDLKAKVDALLAKIKSGVPPSDQEVRDALAGVKGAYNGLGPMKMYGDSDVEAKRKEIFDRRSLGVDRAMNLASAQGFSDTLRRGLGDSTQAADTRDELVRKFADVYGNLDAQALADATGQVNTLANLQLGQRKGVLDEASKGFNVEGWMNLFGNNLKSFLGNKQLDATQLHSLLASLSDFNKTAGTQAGNLVTGASNVASASRLAAGGAKERLFNGIFNTGSQPTNSSGGGQSGGWGNLVTGIRDLFGGGSGGGNIHLPDFSSVPSWGDSDWSYLSDFGDVGGSIWN